jgi:cysteinyl-tRNA synthetase
MELRLYDTLSRDKRVFAPLNPERVRMYVCGPTVYDFAHIGNARPVIVFDVLFRLLRHLYGADHVTYVRNITDVDDKINARAAEEYPGLPLNEAIREVTEKTDRQFHEDVAALGCLPPTVEPRATEHIAEMRMLIERLVETGHAYVADDHVLFDVPSMPDYGRLAKRSLDEMIAGARVDVAPYKRNPMDFVLWKPSKPGEPSWPSPAGIATPGRPGWHIECSAMSWRHLGEVFDIHGGGIDLVFPHHENEIAQSRSAFHTPLMANFWMHNGFLQVEGEKMSKSLGNFVTIRELLEGWNGHKWEQPEIRLLMLSTHYRQPLDWTLQGLKEARQIVLDWKNITANVEHRKIKIIPSQELLAGLFDDLNTAEVILSLHSKAKLATQSDAVAAQFYSDLVFLRLLNDRRDDDAKVLSDPEIEHIVSSSPPSLDKPSDLQIRNRVTERVRFMLNTIDSTSNVFSVSTSVATTLSTIFSNAEGMPFITLWKKHGPKYVSPIDMRTVEARISIEELNRKIETRVAARKAKNFAESDRIRDELAAMGIVLKDSKDGTTWEIAR